MEKIAVVSIVFITIALLNGCIEQQTSEISSDTSAMVDPKKITIDQQTLEIHMNLSGAKPTDKYKGSGKSTFKITNNNEVNVAPGRGLSFRFYPPYINTDDNNGNKGHISCDLEGIPNIEALSSIIYTVTCHAYDGVFSGNKFSNKLIIESESTTKVGRGIYEIPMTIITD